MSSELEKVSLAVSNAFKEEGEEGKDIGGKEGRIERERIHGNRNNSVRNTSMWSILSTRKVLLRWKKEKKDRENEEKKKERKT